MKIQILLFLYSISCLLKLSAQKDSIGFIYRDWYANGYGDKELNVGDIIKLDTISLNGVSKNFMKWEFQKSGDFINMYVYAIKEGEFKGQIIGISDDDVKWELDPRSSKLKIIKEGFISRYKIMRLNKSNLALKKLNKI